MGRKASKNIGFYAFLVGMGYLNGNQGSRCDIDSNSSHLAHAGSLALFLCALGRLIHPFQYDDFVAGFQDFKDKICLSQL